jgi:hypothetical protein
LILIVTFPPWVAELRRSPDIRFLGFYFLLDGPRLRVTERVDYLLLGFELLAFVLFVVLRLLIGPRIPKQ